MTQTPRTLTAILNDIAEHTTIATRDMETVPYKSRMAFQIGIRQSTDALVELRNEYKNRILSNTIGFFLFGDKARVNKFAEVSHVDSGTVSINALEMYESLADTVAPTMGACREFNVDQIARLLPEIRSLCIDLGVEEHSVPAPRAGAVVTLKTRDELVQHIRTMIRESIGDWLNARYISSRIWEKALADKYSAAVLVCTVSNATIDEEQAMSCFSTKHNLQLDSESEIDPGFISKMYEKYTKKNKKQVTADKA